MNTFFHETKTTMAEIHDDHNWLQTSYIPETSLWLSSIMYSSWQGIKQFISNV